MPRLRLRNTFLSPAPFVTAFRIFGSHITHILSVHMYVCTETHNFEFFRKTFVFVLTRLAVSEGADWPSAEFLIRTRFVCSTEPGQTMGLGSNLGRQQFWQGLFLNWMQVTWNKIMGSCMSFHMFFENYKQRKILQLNTQRHLFILSKSYSIKHLLEHFNLGQIVVGYLKYSKCKSNHAWN